MTDQPCLPGFAEHRAQFVDIAADEPAPSFRPRMTGDPRYAAISYPGTAALAHEPSYNAPGYIAAVAAGVSRL